MDAAPVEFPLETAAQRAGDADTLGEPWERGEPVDVPERSSDPVEQVVLSRSSQRRMDPAKSLTGSVARSALASRCAASTSPTSSP